MIPREEIRSSYIEPESNGDARELEIPRAIGDLQHHTERMLERLIELVNRLEPFLSERSGDENKMLQAESSAKFAQIVNESVVKIDEAGNILESLLRRLEI